MLNCSHCGKEGIDPQRERVIYNYTGNRICSDCIPLTHQHHYDQIVITEAGPKRVGPFCAYSEKQQRDKFIQLIYLLYDRKINPAAYRLMNHYRKKGYTWIGMARAIEWFYLIKNNSAAKSNNNIGIIPYVYDEAQKHYNLRAEQNLHKAKKWFNSHQQVVDETIISKKEQRKTKEIDMDDIMR